VTNPYNSYSAQSTARASATKTTATYVDVIGKMKISELWKQRFRLVEKAGGTEMPFMGDLEPEELLQLYGNGLAFAFGPFYYYALGMQRQAVGFGACWLALFGFCALTGWWVGLISLGGLLALASSIRANVSYYAKRVLHADRWL
jgi:hypothetical protein